MKKSQFNVYKTGSYYNLGTIYAVVTGTKDEKTSHIDTEWFYYVTYSHKNSGLKIASGFFESIKEFWNSYTIESLKDAIYFNEIVPVLERINEVSFYTKVELEKIKNENLVYLGVENMNFINYLKNNTNCAELRKFIEVIPIIKLEKEKII
jgi:hypothetical protein